jgi:hypothetical protein
MTVHVPLDSEISNIISKPSPGGVSLKYFSFQVRSCPADVLLCKKPPNQCNTDLEAVQALLEFQDCNLCRNLTGMLSF